MSTGPINGVAEVTEFAAGLGLVPVVHIGSDGARHGEPDVAVADPGALRLPAAVG